MPLLLAIQQLEEVRRPVVHWQPGVPRRQRVEQWQPVAPQLQPVEQ
jgi:hypothetical protein